jgi:predicted Ser/Thr protein kinase
VKAAQKFFSEDKDRAFEARVKIINLCYCCPINPDVKDDGRERPIAHLATAT